MAIRIIAGLAPDIRQAQNARQGSEALPPAAGRSREEETK